MSGVVVSYWPAICARQNGPQCAQRFYVWLSQPFSSHDRVDSKETLVLFSERITDAHLMPCRDVGPRASMILFSI
jgi:hypothetical protein